MGDIDAFPGSDGTLEITIHLFEWNLNFYLGSGQSSQLIIV